RLFVRTLATASQCLRQHSCPTDDRQGEPMNRRQFTLGNMNALAALACTTRGIIAVAQPGHDLAGEKGAAAPSAFAATGPPPISQRTFISDAVEDTIVNVKGAIRNPRLAKLFE